MSQNEHVGPLSEPTTFNILFVCTGNTCRSPMATAIARREVDRRGLSHVAVASAGTAAADGAPATEYAVRVAAGEGLDLAGHAARLLTDDLIAWADLVLVMGPAQLHAVADRGGAEKVALVTDFLDQDGLGEPVEDPFGADEEAYRRAFDQLEAAIAGVFQRLEPILSP